MNMFSVQSILLFSDKMQKASSNHASNRMEMGERCGTRRARIRPRVLLSSRFCLQRKQRWLNSLKEIGAVSCFTLKGIHVCQQRERHILIIQCYAFRVISSSARNWWC